MKIILPKKNIKKLNSNKLTIEDWEYDNRTELNMLYNCFIRRKLIYKYGHKILNKINYSKFINFLFDLKYKKKYENFITENNTVVNYNPDEKFEFDHINEFYNLFKLLQDHKNRTCINILNNKNINDFIDFIKINSSLYDEYIEKYYDEIDEIEDSNNNFIDENYEIITITKY